MGHFAGKGGPTRPPGLREPAGAISRERDLCVFATPAPEGPKKMGVMVEMKKTLAKTSGKEYAVNQKAVRSAGPFGNE